MNWCTRRFSKKFLHSILNLNFSFSLNNVTTGYQISQCFWMDLRKFKDLFVIWECNCLHLCGWGRASEETNCLRITQRRPDAGVACKKAKQATPTAVTCFSRFSSLGVRKKRSPWRARIFSSWAGEDLLQPTSYTNSCPMWRRRITGLKIISAFLASILTPFQFVFQYILRL